MGKALWGINSTNTAKPIWLTDKQKEQTIATKGGWVLKHPSGISEKLVAIANLSGKLGPAAITEVRWSKTSILKNTVGTLYVDFDEPIAVTGVPRITLTGGAPLASVTKISGGTNYTTATAVVKGDGFGAVANAVVELDKSVTVTLTNLGSGYRTASIVVTGDGAGANYTVALGTPVSITASYTVLEGVNNSMVFSFTAPNNYGDTLKVNAQSIALNGGTIVEALSPSTPAVLVIGAEDLGTSLSVTAV